MAFSRVPNLAYTLPLFPSLKSKQKIQVPPNQKNNRKSEATSLKQKKETKIVRVHTISIIEYSMKSIILYCIVERCSIRCNNEIPYTVLTHLYLH